MCSPNLLILGPPKCGTSSLFRWLADHPGVLPSNPKETFYLVDADSPFLRPGSCYLECGEAGWQTYFDTTATDCPIRLEGTTHTLFQSLAIEVLSRQTPQPHVVVVLRKPSERIYSSFQFTRHVLAGIDPELDFARFHRLRQRRDTARLARHTRIDRSLWVLLRDLDYSRYHRWLEPWQRALDPGRLHILLFEDLMADPRSAVSRLAETLALDTSGPRAQDFYGSYPFPRENATFEPRSRRLHHWARRLRPFVPRHRLSLGLYRLYLGLQRRRRRPERPPADQVVLAEIDELLADDNRRLTETFGLDLGAWG